MNLIEIYIYEVTRRLPEKHREDIALELRSTIEDMLPEDYSEKDIKAVLEKLGNPAVLASGYRDQPMHLIGQPYFDVYVTLLKMILPIAAVISLISTIAAYFIGYSGEASLMNGILNIIGKGIAGMIETGIQVFFWLTIVFAIVERTDKGKDGKQYTRFHKWTPDDLKTIPSIPKKKAIRKCEVFGSLMWTAIWAALYFHANHLVGIYKGSGEGLTFVTPAFNHEVLVGYWPIVVVVIVLEIAFALYKLIKRQWTKRMAICNAVLELFGTIVFIVIVKNPTIMTPEFITYMADLFTITAQQLKTWIIGGSLFIYMLSAAMNVFDGFRKAGSH
ncbi:HAAS signaling domain-containing protein [Neobacillus mesonae]|uniref:HAAS signaling domain-containing protein n=1 Tax=Neobacillus mesonae TaxID=1193713 RepID=UPI00203D3817|nr:hypothetical protein [Neobacillus mesonae]MCM3570604.1 hypothetical protein [Neobacillus mesonae]